MGTWQHLLEDPDAFKREDERDDASFYAQPRRVSHLDSQALETVQELIQHLVVEDEPDVLDLMASVDSHLPSHLQTCRVTGLGLNGEELEANQALDVRVVHDLNHEPRLPFADASFDVVLNVVSIGYVTQPLELFTEIARALRPGGLCLIVFSNRSFPTKEVRVWELLHQDELTEYVAHWFSRIPDFEAAQTWRSLGRPRPADDRHAGQGGPSDPVFAVWADLRGAPAGRADRTPPAITPSRPDPDVVAARTDAIPETNACPHCEEALRVWAISEHPMTTWDHDLLVCVNDGCPYVVGGWEAFYQQGVPGHTTRFCYDPRSKSRVGIAVPSLNVIKDALR